MQAIKALATPAPTHPSTAPRRALLKHMLGLGALTLGAQLPLAAWAQSAAFDHRYSDWNALLKKHVRWLPDGKQSQVDYAGFLSQRSALKSVLDGMSAVTQAQFNGWRREQQMAFLINAYNAFTVELILSRFPKLKSIKDLGSLLQSPWKKPFFQLLGAERHLDWVEHEQLRPNYQEPRIHAAVNCASIGCPALRDEAFVAERLEGQLEDGMRRFLGDATRNRLRNGQLEVSEIFKWFKEDFEKGHRGAANLQQFLALYAEQLSPDPAQQALLRSGAVSIRHLSYDWNLNHLKP